MNFCTGNWKHTWLFDDRIGPYRHASSTYSFEQKSVRRWLQPAYFSDVNPCDYGPFHAPKMATVTQAYPTIDLLWETIDREITYGNANGKYMAIQKLAERWNERVKNKGK